MNKINQKILELKSLLTDEYLKKLDNKTQEELYDSIVELAIPLLDYSYLREIKLRKSFVSNRFWSAWKINQTNNAKQSNN